MEKITQQHWDRLSPDYKHTDKDGQRSILTNINGATCAVTVEVVKHLPRQTA